MQGIFISYRRQDSQDAVGRLVDHIRRHLPDVPVFPGVEALEAGVEFSDAVGRALLSCDVMLAVIGPNWASDDHTRLEIAAALERPEVRIIPVLVDGAQMPDATDLPADLQALCRRNAIVLGQDRWDHDVARLVDELSNMLQRPVLAPAPAQATREAADEVIVVRRNTVSVPEAGRPGPWSTVQRGLRQLRRIWQGPVTVTGGEGADPEMKDEGPFTGGRPPERETARMSDTAPATPGVTPRDSAAEPVHLGASAPRQVKPGEEFTARFVAYTAGHEAEIRSSLAELSPRSESHLNIKTCQWQPGTALTVRLAARNLHVAPTEQSLVWDGSKALVEFDVAVPEAAALGTTVLKFDVLIEGIAVAMLRLDLEIAKQTSFEAAQANGSAARSAFASYSSQDRQRVLDRIDALRIAAGLDIFLDCLSLKPSEQWKRRLDSEIRERDLFMLFWSAAAAQSQWVEWEWREALALKGLDAMQIQPLENGIKPPPELEALHFGSVAMYARVGETAARQAQAFPLSPQVGGEGRAKGESGKTAG